MNVWQVLLSVIRGTPERWNPKEDDTMRLLRRETVLATREANRMRRQRSAFSRANAVSWESLFTEDKR